MSRYRTPQDLPPRQRETWLAVQAYLAAHPGVGVRAACRAVGVNSATYGNARRALFGRTDRGVATDAEAFGDAGWDEDELRDPA